MTRLRGSRASSRRGLKSRPRLYGNSTVRRARLQLGALFRPPTNYELMTRMECALLTAKGVR